MKHLKAFAIVHLTSEMRTDGIPRVVSVVYGDDLASAERFVLSDAHELQALNGGSFNVVAIFIAAPEGHVLTDGETVFIRLANTGNFWRVDFAQFGGPQMARASGSAWVLHEVPLTLLETEA